MGIDALDTQNRRDPAKKQAQDRQQAKNLARARIIQRRAERNQARREERSR